MDHVPVNNLRYFCQFCLLPCCEQEDCYFCAKCKTYFNTEQNGRISFINMSCEIDNKNYLLSVDYNRKESRIIEIPPSQEDTVVLVIDLPYILNKITPDNIAAKLKTIITFS